MGVPAAQPASDPSWPRTTTSQSPGLIGLLSGIRAAMALHRRACPGSSARVRWQWSVHLGDEWRAQRRLQRAGKLPLTRVDLDTGLHGWSGTGEPTSGSIVRPRSAATWPENERLACLKSTSMTVSCWDGSSRDCGQHRRGHSDHSAPSNLSRLMAGLEPSAGAPGLAAGPQQCLAVSANCRSARLKLTA